MTDQRRKPRNQTAIILIPIVVLATLFGGKLLTPVLAADDDGTMIDKDFQQAVRKHVERRFFNLIDATDTQRQAIDKLITTQADDLLPLREKLKEGLVQLNNMAAKDDVTNAQITDKAHELRALHEQIQDARLSTMLKIREQLTPDQRKRVSNRINDLLDGSARPALLRRLQSFRLPDGSMNQLL